ncbi:unnamed protein product [Gongylonema pulchrum]|uniref:Uncharacterized protein n=1 Tax=Gongylonema pulchrum TaxID=637853 RepID=A0A3P7N5V4_9BILA|nr:unnamed protein product [Gongylonema pulchrum]
MKVKAVKKTKTAQNLGTPTNIAAAYRSGSLLIRVRWKKRKNQKKKRSNWKTYVSMRSRLMKKWWTKLQWKRKMMSGNHYLLIFGNPIFTVQLNRRPHWIWKIL